MSMCEEQDWISALPDVILHHILSFFAYSSYGSSPLSLTFQSHLIKGSLNPNPFSYTNTLTQHQALNSALSSPLEPFGTMTLMFSTALSLPFQNRSTKCSTVCFTENPLLFDCVIDDETLNGLLSNCPLLESLTLDWCHRLLKFKTSWWQSMRLKHLDG
ncbi:hypothetical protein PVK06_010910 [Gossypium arboreum]|uniref:Uncharacterized protein n=1 Tax=Gossypium arboreum TaxID=29729 RepID=A0ABR0Q8K7_GOSAR|nr:hypothetical protein PVK06_010910 [Gossypium arboreum]